MNQSINTYFCLDIGGTGSRGALFNSFGERLAHAEADAGALSLGVHQAQDAILSIWDRIVSSLEPDEWQKENTSLIAGVAGYSLPGRVQELSQLLNEFARVEIVSDGYGALLGATDGKPGALISIGTGIGALRLGENGKTHAISSWGFPAGDAGGGAWLGLRVMGDFLKYLDGIALSATLSGEFPQELSYALLERIGTQPHSIMQWQSEARPKDFASLAPLVVAHAKAGDTYCVALLNEAAELIIHVGNALIEASNTQIFLSGGLAKTLLPYCLASGGHINWKLSQGDPLKGLYLLGKGEAPELNLLTRPGLQN